MSNDFEILKNISAIYRCAFYHQTIHKNTMRNQLLNRGKISSKNKFYQAFDRVVAGGGLVKEKEFVSINPAAVRTAFLQEDKTGAFYVVMPITQKKYRLSNSVASSYRVGDPLHIVVEKIGERDEAIVLGKNYDTDYEEYVRRRKEEKEQSLKESNLALGRVVKLSHDDLVFIPNKKSFTTRQIPILNDKEEWGAFEDKLCIMRLVDENAPLLGGHIIEVKNEAGNPIHEYDAIAESYGAVMSWSGEKLEAEIARILTKINSADYELISEQEAAHGQKGKIVDLRNLPFTSVDPPKCKDMDDIIYSTFNENGDFVCYTAVANTAKFFEPDSEIGKKYFKAGLAIYTPNKAYGILPPQLSTVACSFTPGEDRLALVAKVVIDKTTGQPKERRIYDAIVRSRKKYAYDITQEIFDRLGNDCSKEYLMKKCIGGGDEALSEDEQVVMNCYAGQKIKQGFEERKMIRFVSNQEREVKLDDDLQKVLDIVPVQHLYYHEVIEAFMITANEAKAKYAMDNNINIIYRVHDKPNPHKMDKANEFFELLGIDFEGDLTAEGTRGLVELIKNTPNEEVVNDFLIKTQSRAVYSVHPYSEKSDKRHEFEGQRISHYALQSPHYCHATAPIRRAPDYVTQYNILAHIHRTKPISLSKIQKIVEIANYRQIDVDQAHKDIDDINDVLYCEDHIGEKMRGRITKIRTASAEEGYEDDIIVIVKEASRGISVEIPLSQILGRPCNDYELSSQRCAVYDRRGNIVLKLCHPLDFIIEKADRLTMRVIGRTNKEMVKQTEKKAKSGRQAYSKEQVNSPEKIHQRGKKTRKARLDDNHKHSYEDELDLEDKRFS